MANHKGYMVEKWMMEYETIVGPLVSQINRRKLYISPAVVFKTANDAARFLQKDFTDSRREANHYDIVEVEIVPTGKRQKWQINPDVPTAGELGVAFEEKEPSEKVKDGAIKEGGAMNKKAVPPIQFPGYWEVDYHGTGNGDGGWRVQRIREIDPVIWVRKKRQAKHLVAHLNNMWEQWQTVVLEKKKSRDGYNHHQQAPR